MEIINLYKLLQENHEYVISKQLLRSGTSIGANVHEAEAAQSTKDFISKMAIASKEAREIKYWLRLLYKSNLVNVSFEVYMSKIDDIINVLTKIVKTTSDKLKHH